MFSAKRLASGADAEQWVWYKLKESLVELTPVLTEAQHVHAATAKALEHEAFSRKYDERDVRSKSQRCLASLSELSAAAGTLESYATKALEAQLAADAAWCQQLEEERTSAESWRRSIRRELAKLEAEVAAAHQAQRRAEGDATAWRWKKEQTEAELTEAHKAHEQYMEVAFRSCEQVQAECDNRVGTALRGSVALQEENAALRKDVVRASVALDELTTEHRALQEEMTRLRAENARWRESFGAASAFKQWTSPPRLQGGVDAMVDAPMAHGWERSIGTM